MRTTILMLLLLLATAVGAQRTVVSGMVTDGATGKPLAVTSSEPSASQPIRGRDSFDQRDAFFDKVDYFRDPQFWQDYNIIEPTESLDRAVHRLLKRAR